MSHVEKAKKMSFNSQKRYTAKNAKSENLVEKHSKKIIIKGDFHINWKFK